MGNSGDPQGGGVGFGSDPNFAIYVDQELECECDRGENELQREVRARIWVRLRRGLVNTHIFTYRHTVH